MTKILTITITLSLIVFAAEWQALNSPHIGTGTDISIGWHSDNHYWVTYIADELYMVYNSTNDGESWDSLYYDDDARGPSCIITNPSHAQLAYLGKPGGGSTPPWYNIFKTTNCGQSWVCVSHEDIKSKYPACFAMHPDYPDTIYAGFFLRPYMTGAQGIYKTTNGGGEWFWSGIVRYSVWDIFVHPDNPDILYAATDSSLRKTTDGGMNWSPLNAPGGILAIYSITLKTPDTLFVITAAEDYGKIWRTTDDGENWDCVFTSPIKPDYDLDIYPRGIEVDKDDRTLMYAIILPFGFYRSTDGGDSWAPSNTGIGDKHLYAICQHPGVSDCIFVGGCVAVYKSTDNGVTWTEKTEGMRLASVCNVSAKNGVVCAGSTIPAYALICGISKSIDAGESFSWIYHTNLHCLRRVQIAPSNTNTIFGAYCDIEQTRGFIVRTINGGTEWDVDQFTGYGLRDLTISSTSCDSVRVCSFTPQSQLPSTRVWWTDQYGGEWDYHQFSFTGNLNTIVTDPLYSQTIYTGGCWWIYEPEANKGPILKKSTDGCATWNDAVTGIVGSVSDVAINPINTQNLYAVSDSGPFKSTNAGQFWSKKKIGLPDYWATDIIIDPEEPTIVYTLLQSESPEYNTLYCSVDGAAQWFEFTLPSGNYPPEYIFDIAIDEVYPDKLYAGTQKGVCTFFPQYKIKPLTSSINTASSNSSARKIIRGDIDNIWVTYASDNIIYAVHSSDAGTTWSRKMEIGSGNNPAISYDPNLETPIPSIVWWAPGEKDTIYFSRCISDYNWTTPVEIKVSGEDIKFGPPCFVIGTDAIGRIVYEENGHVKYTEFDIYDPDPISPEEVGVGKDPSIGFMPPSSNNPEIHVVWEDNDKIRYRSRTIAGTWGNRETVYSSNSQHPSIEVEGSNVYVVWEKAGDIDYQYAVYTQNGAHTWSKLKYFSTSYDLDYPVLTGGNAMSCYAAEGSGEIYFWYNDGSAWTGPINISTSTEYSHYPHIVHKQTILGTMVYFVWTENDNPPYDVRFDNYTFGGFNPEADLAFYIAEGGDSTASAYNLQRDGFRQYGAEFYKKIDYDADCLEYQFMGLNPDREYILAAYVYQEGYANLPITVKVDNILVGGISLPPETLIVCKKMLPEKLYADHAINIKIFGNNAVNALLVLYEYEKEAGGEGGGPQSTGSAFQGLEKLMLNVYPNPAHKEFTIEYSLPKESAVDISVFDVSGRLVNTLVNANQQAGQYRKSFCSDDLSQGVYFIRINTKKESIVRKVIFLR